MYTAYGNFAILLSLTVYLLTLQYFDFYAPLDINGKFRQKVKTLHDIDVTKGKTLPDFIMSFLLLSKTDIGLKLFSFIMLGMVTL